MKYYVTHGSKVYYFASKREAEAHARLLIAMLGYDFTFVCKA